MLTSNDIPLASNPLDRAAHRRKDDAWLEAAFRDPNVLIFIMQHGMPLVEGQVGTIGDLFLGSPHAQSRGASPPTP